MFQEIYKNGLSNSDVEKNQKFLHSGCVEVICGSMFSGKTEELMRRIRRVQYANVKLQIFKPSIDTRYIAGDIVSHDKRNITAHCVDDSSEILAQLDEDTQVVACDEAQFFDDKFPKVCNILANKGIRVIIAGLDTDYTGTPFGVMPILLAQAEYVTKLHAICSNCGNIAQFTYRKTDEVEQKLIGAKDEYEPLCRTCYQQEQIHKEVQNCESQVFN